MKRMTTQILPLPAKQSGPTLMALMQCLCIRIPHRHWPTVIVLCAPWAIQRFRIDEPHRAGRDVGLITLARGVDPEKAQQMLDLVRAELARLKSAPPTPEEIAAAKRNLIGRKVSAAQSNTELADAMALDIILQGKILSPSSLADRLDCVTRDDVLSILPDYTNGSVVSIEVESSP